MADRTNTAGPGPYRWVVFALLALAYLLVYFHRLCPAVVALDMQADLKAPGALLGFLAAAYFYPYALMQLPAGLLADSWGPRRSITISFALAGLASLALGTVDSVGPAIAARVLVGMGVAMVFVATMKALTNWFNPLEFARMTGLLMALGGVGVYTAATPLALLSSWLGWRGSFVVIGVATLVLTLLIWIFVRNTPEEKGLPPVPRFQGKTAAPEAIGLWQGMKMVAGTPAFWSLAVWFFFTCGVFFSFGGLWAGPYLIQIYGMDKVGAGAVLSMLALAMVLGSPLLSHLSDKVFFSRKWLMVGAAALLSCLAALLALHPSGMPQGLLYVWFFLLSLSSSSIVVIGFTSAKELFPVRMAGTSVGMVNLFPFLGGAVMQPVSGWILDSAGSTPGTYRVEDFQSCFWLYAASGLVALIAALFTRETFPSEARRPRKQN